jgi:hypothetical protein
VEVRGGLRKCNKEELHHLNSSLIIIRIIKAGRIRLGLNVTHIGEIKVKKTSVALVR